MRYSFLGSLPGADAFATPSFFGIIYGKELYTKENGVPRELTVEEVRELALKRLKLAYEEAVRKVTSDG